MAKYVIRRATVTIEDTEDGTRTTISFGKGMSVTIRGEIEKSSLPSRPGVTGQATRPGGVKVVER